MGKKFVILLTICLILSGCTVVFGEKQIRPIEPLTSEEAKGKERSDQEALAPLREGAEKEEDSAYPYRIENSLGEGLVFDKPPQRILLFNTLAHDIFVNIEAMDSVIGGFDLDNISDKISMDKNNPNLAKEAIEANPDLIFYDNQVERYWINLWKEKGISCISLPVSSYEDIFSYIKYLGHLSNKKVKSQKLVDIYRKQLSELKEKVRDKRPVNVFIEASNKPLSTFGSKTLFSESLKILGANNLADTMEFYGPVDRNFLKGKSIDAYIILYSDKDLEEKEKRLLTLEEENNPLLKKIYLLHIEEPRNISLDYFEILEDLNSIVEDARI